jgi:glutathione S-transferase
MRVRANLRGRADGLAPQLRHGRGADPTTRQERSMKLYHSPGSRSTRVLWALEEIGVPYEVTILTLDERRGEEHRKRHPLGRVPVLELDDGQLMFESAAACILLADRHPEAELAPAFDSPARPLFYQWMFFAMTEIEPAAGKWARARRDGADEAEEAEKFAEIAAALERPLSQGPWLLGDQFSVADIVSARILNIVFSNGLTEGHEKVRRYWGEAVERPAHVRANQIGRAPAQDSKEAAQPR